ncbi:hypothetical protein I79_003027 [Cricetulus griseus]|uniref:Uncharacterized protein n=1 Tax=Cricetulus griseus TaxID=10029 RepID=G3GYX9_CRIGR|nr:hypothetical protein I79_003027 [Cricetulus griseus]
MVTTHLALGRLRQENSEFEDSLGYIMILYLKPFFSSPSPKKENGSLLQGVANSPYWKSF